MNKLFTMTVVFCFFSGFSAKASQQFTVVCKDTDSVTRANLRVDLFTPLFNSAGATGGNYMAAQNFNLEKMKAEFSVAGMNMNEYSVEIREEFAPGSKFVTGYQVEFWLRNSGRTQQNPFIVRLRSALTVWQGITIKDTKPLDPKIKGTWISPNEVKTDDIVTGGAVIGRAGQDRQSVLYGSIDDLKTHEQALVLCRLTP